MVSIAAVMPRAARRADASWRLAGALLLLFLAGATSLTGVIEGAEWWFLMAFVATLVLASGAVFRAMGVPRQLSPALSALVLLGALTALFGGGLGFALVIPTPQSIEHLLQTAGRIGTVINEQAVPAQPVEELLLLLATGAGLVALALDMIGVALRMPALAGVPVLMMLSVPIIFLDDGINPVVLAVCVAAFAWLLRVDIRERRGGPAAPLPALAVVASVTVVALVGALTAPGFTAGGAFAVSPGGSNVGIGVNPLVDVGRDLHRPSSVPVLQYVTSAFDPPYLKLITLDTFTGTRWMHTGGRQHPVPEGDSIGPAPGLSPKVPTQEVTTTITVGALQSRWLPAPYPVIGLHGQAGDWRWQDDDLTISSLLANAEFEQYTAVSLTLHPTQRQLLQADAALGRQMQSDLALPSNVPAIITRTAQQATAGDTTEYEKAVDLQNYFRDSGFSYSLKTPLQQGYDGDGLKVIAKFLQKKSGYCVHFASAMAIMARSLGIPARVAVGYLPGTNTGVDGNGSLIYTVTSSELHSWPELYFAGIGWLAFEPTVGRGTVPSYAVPSTALTPLEQLTPAAPASAAPASPPAEAKQTVAQHAAASAAARAHTTAGTAGLGVLLLVLLLVPAVTRLLIRRARFVRIRAGRTPAATAWHEVCDTARDLGVSIDGTETPRAVAARLSQPLPGEPAREALARIRHALERESYGRAGDGPERPAPPAASLADDLRVVLAGLPQGQGRRRAIIAVVAPVSLLRQPARRAAAVSGRPAPGTARVG